MAFNPYTGFAGSRSPWPNRGPGGVGPTNWEEIIRRMSMQGVPSLSGNPWPNRGSGGMGRLGTRSEGSRSNTSGTPPMRLGAITNRTGNRGGRW